MAGIGSCDPVCTRHGVPRPVLGPERPQVPRPAAACVGFPRSWAIEQAGASLSLAGLRARSGGGGGTTERARRHRRRSFYGRTLDGRGSGTAAWDVQRAGADRSDNFSTRILWPGFVGRLVCPAAAQYLELAGRNVRAVPKPAAF